MEPNAAHQPGDGPWVSRRTVDVAVGIVAFAIGVVMMLDTYRLGAGWEGGSPQSGYFPFRIGAIICITAASVVFRAWWSARHEAAKVFVTWPRLRLVLAVLLPTLLYILGIQFLGIYVASALFIAAFMRKGGGYGWVKSAVTGAATGAALFWLFEIQFLVPLPKGPLEALFGF